MAAEQQPEEEPGTTSVRPKVLVDLNIVLDVLQKREPHYGASAKVWASVEKARLEGFIAAHTVTTLFYLVHQHLPSATAQETIRDVVRVFSIAPVDEGVIGEALSYAWNDFEDAVQMAAAVRIGAKYLITRNPKDFGKGPVPVLQPAELPAILQKPH